MESISGASDGSGSRSASVPTTRTSELDASVPLLVNLTDRERDVLALMAQGLTNKEISARLNIGRRTVDTHVDRVMSKLNATTRTRAVAEAGRLGLLSPNGGTTAPETPVPPHNLPIQLTTLVGRAEDLDEVRSALDRYRLVTLAGSGGVGKTRLAIRAGLELLPSYPDGVWFFDLSPIADPTFVASALAKVLGVRENARDPLADSIVRALAGKKALLVVDNCEHVLDCSAALVHELLRSCDNVRILATSRDRTSCVMVWECTAGRFNWNYCVDEML